MDSLSYLGIVLLTVISPLPSEVVMPFVGFLVAQGKLNFFLAILASATGSLIGALPWYLAGRFLGEQGIKRLGRRRKWLKISPKKLEEAKRWFQQHGGKAVFLCRPFPGVRTVISLPAGISGMLVVPFVLYTGLGSMLWSAILALTGYVLGTRYYLVKDYLGSLPQIGLGIFILLALFGVGRQIFKNSRSQAEAKTKSHELGVGAKPDLPLHSVVRSQTSTGVDRKLPG